MRRTLTTIILVSALFLVPAMAQPAAAQVYGGFSVGGWFRIGGVSFSLVFGAPVEGAQPGYYYRTPAEYGFLGPPCRGTFREGGYIYYDPTCPTMEGFLARHHQRPELLFEGFAPPPVWRGQFYGSRYDRSGRYDRDGRYDRYRGRGERRYDRSWSRNDRKSYYERHGLSRREHHRGRVDRDRGRGHGNSRHREGRGRGHGRGGDGHHRQ